jgi:AcrR family transcriptional regulator
MDDLRDVISSALVSEGSARPKLRTRGVTPAQQARSKATFAALVTAGLKIAERNDFFASTVDEVAKAAKVSVGAFYERFESKETYFSVLQEIVATRIEIAVRKRISRPDFAELDFDGAVRAIVDAWLTGVRLHRGLIRASLRHIPVRDDAWFPLRRLGAHMGDIFVQVLSERVSASGRRGLEARVRVALQFVHGAVVNIILNNPGPVGLDDRELDERIQQVIALLVRDENGHLKLATR